MKIMIAVPSMDYVAAEFAQSLASLRKVGECKVVFQLSSLIYDARNNLLKQAIRMQADYVLWLDSDMVFPPETLEKLMADIEGREIVTGIYYRRRPPYSPVLMKRLAEGVAEDLTVLPEEELFEVEGCGFGCVLMRTDVARDVLIEHRDWFTPFGGLGEDLAFCLRARDCGHKIWADRSIRLGHVGHAVITSEFWTGGEENA